MVLCGRIQGRRVGYRREKPEVCEASVARLIDQDIGLAEKLN